VARKARRPPLVVAMTEEGDVIIGAAKTGMALLAMRAGLRTADRRNGVSQVPPDLGAILATLRAADQWYHARPVSPAKPEVADLGFAGRSSAGGSPLLEVGDVARWVGVSAQAVRRAARDGRLAGRRAGRVWTFSEADVIAWAATRKERG
jgi:Helix-turn-helix domain